MLIYLKKLYSLKKYLSFKVNTFNCTRLNKVHDFLYIITINVLEHTKQAYNGTKDEYQQLVKN